MDYRPKGDEKKNTKEILRWYKNHRDHFCLSQVSGTPKGGSKEAITFPPFIGALRNFLKEGLNVKSQAQ